MSLTLSPDELRELTGKRRPTAQARVLGELGIPFKPRGDGILLVSRAAAEAALGGKPAVSQPVEWEVDSEAIRNHGKASTAH